MAWLVKVGRWQTRKSIPQPDRDDPGWKNQNMNAEERRHAEDSRKILDGLVKATDRRDEVLRVVGDSEDLDEAIRRLAELLELDEFVCHAILDMQVRRFTRDQRRTIAAQADEIRSSLSCRRPGTDTC
jgi:DNA gyrase/topoisomerase IV subunit A